MFVTIYGKAFGVLLGLLVSDQKKKKKIGNFKGFKHTFLSNFLFCDGN